MFPPPPRCATAILACAAMLVCSAVAQPAPTASFAPAPEASPYLVRAWTTRDGLPINHIESIAQTPDGYLWLGTAAGLIRFDGMRFRLYGRGRTEGVERNVREGALGGPARAPRRRLDHGRRCGRRAGRALPVSRRHGSEAMEALAAPMQSRRTATCGSRSGKGGAARIRADGRIERYPVGDGVTGAVGSIRVTPRGTVFAVTERGIERFDGGTIPGRRTLRARVPSSPCVRPEDGPRRELEAGRIVRFSGEGFEIVPAPSRDGDCRVLRVDADGSVAPVRRRGHRTARQR